MKKIIQLKKAEIMLVAGSMENTSTNKEVCPNDTTKNFNLKPFYYSIAGIATAITITSLGYYIFFRRPFMKGPSMQDYRLIEKTKKNLSSLKGKLAHDYGEYIAFKYYEEIGVLK